MQDSISTKIIQCKRLLLFICSHPGSSREQDCGLWEALGEGELVKGSVGWESGPPPPPYPPKVTSTSEAPTEPARKGRGSRPSGEGPPPAETRRVHPGVKEGDAGRKSPHGNGPGPGGNWKFSAMPVGEPRGLGEEAGSQRVEEKCRGVPLLSWANYSANTTHGTHSWLLLCFFPPPPPPPFQKRKGAIGPRSFFRFC